MSSDEAQAAPEPTAPVTPEPAAPQTVQAAPETAKKQEPQQPQVRDPSAYIKALEEKVERFAKKAGVVDEVAERLTALESENRNLRATNALAKYGIVDDELVKALAPGLSGEADPDAVAARLAERLKASSVLTPRAPSSGAPALAKDWRDRTAQRVKDYGSKS